jgi:hypothetical protein
MGDVLKEAWGTSYNHPVKRNYLILKKILMGDVGAQSSDEMGDVGAKSSLH